MSTFFQGKSFSIGAPCDDPELSKNDMVILVKRIAQGRSLQIFRFRPRSIST